MDKVITVEMINRNVKELLSLSAKILTGKFSKEEGLYENG